MIKKYHKDNANQKWLRILKIDLWIFKIRIYKKT